MTTAPNANDYLPGQTVTCRVGEAQPGGYQVTVITPAPGENSTSVEKPGFLSTEKVLGSGEEISVQFVCASDKQLLLSPLAVSANPAPEERIEPTLARLCGAQKYKIHTYKAIGTTSPVRLKRAIDLIPAAANADDVTVVETGKHGPRVLVEKLEAEKFTGVLKVASEERLSRSAMLIYKGRVVGCHYACKELPYLVSTEGALELALGDISFTKTMATLYPLPESIILAISSLFLGHLEEHERDERAGAALGHICKQLAEERATACIAITWPPSDDMCFVFIHEGVVQGTYRVDERQISTDPEFAFDLLKRNGDASLQASVLPPELAVGPSTIGFALHANTQPV